jgi:hypothetical protein
MEMVSYPLAAYCSGSVQLDFCKEHIFRLVLRPPLQQEHVAAPYCTTFPVRYGRAIDDRVCLRQNRPSYRTLNA